MSWSNRSVNARRRAMLLPMVEKITLELLADALAKMRARIERGFENSANKFAALADDIGDIKHEVWLMRASRARMPAPPAPTS
jgi:hypothetical protein